MKKVYLLFLLALLPFVVYADPVEINGIYYNLVSKVKTAEVTSNPNKYSGDVTIPTTVTYGGNEYSVVSIDESAFNSCWALTSIIIPNSVNFIASGTFLNCRSLTSVAIPNSVIYIGSNAFAGCSSLTSVNIPNSVTYIDYCAFEGCGLTSVVIPNSVTFIGHSAFYDCKDLTSMSISNSVTFIDDDAFNGCSSLTSVSIPNSVTSICDDTFKNCSSLTSVNIPNSVTSIGKDAFSGCSSLTSVTIPNSVTSIGGYAFLGCRDLTSIAIGSDITIIRNYSFSGCPELIDFYCMAEDVPDTGPNAFVGSYIEYATLHVPAGSVDAYKAVEPWSGFKEILPIAESASITIGGKGLTTYTSKYNLDFSGFGDEVKAYVATGYDYDTKTIWLTRVKDAPAGTALMVKGTATETYEVPVKQTSGSYYKNMFVGNTTGSDMALSETSDGMTNYYLKDGEFKSVKTSANIGDRKSYLQIPTTAPTAKAGSSQTMTMNAYGFASYCGSQDLDFTDVEGLKAYAATGYDDATGIIWLTRVMRVSAGTPLLLMGAPSTEDKVSSYTVPSSAVSSYYTNMLKGNTGTEDLIINTTEGDMTNYYLKGNQLLKVSGTAKIVSGKAYMQIPTRHVTRAEEDEVSGVPFYNIEEEPEVISMQVGTRSIEGDDDDTTGISEVKSDDADRGEWYNLQGQRVGNPGKGIYIKNGKKVIVR